MLAKQGVQQKEQRARDIEVYELVPIEFYILYYSVISSTVNRHLNCMCCYNIFHNRKVSTKLVMLKSSSRSMIICVHMHGCHFNFKQAMICYGSFGKKNLVCSNYT